MTDRQLAYVTLAVAAVSLYINYRMAMELMQAKRDIDAAKGQLESNPLTRAVAAVLGFGG